MTRSPSSVPLAGGAPPPEALRSDAQPLVEIRPLRAMEDCDACVELQRHVWGWDQADVVPATLLHVVDYVGGLASGAFDSGGELLGFVFGISGVRDGELVHWSHMLGVRESARNIGVGRMLKEHQRAVMAKLGIRRMFWSFDPLMAKNAYFNFNRLGATVVDYVPDMYGATGSPLHLGLPTDRLVVTTSTTASESHRPVTRTEPLPVLTPFPRPGDVTMSIDDGSASAEALLIEVPSDILDVTRRSQVTARTWRLAVRDHFQWALVNQYRATSVRRDAASDREFYVMVRRP